MIDNERVIVCPRVQCLLNIVSVIRRSWSSEILFSFASPSQRETGQRFQVDWAGIANITSVHLQLVSTLSQKEFFCPSWELANERQSNMIVAKRNGPGRGGTASCQLPVDRMHSYRVVVAVTLFLSSQWREQANGYFTISRAALKCDTLFIITRSERGSRAGDSMCPERIS